MGKYDDQSEERSPSNAANPMGSSVSAGMPVADGRAEDCFSQGATFSRTFVFYLVYFFSVARLAIFSSASCLYAKINLAPPGLSFIYTDMGVVWEYIFFFPS